MYTLFAKFSLTRHLPVMRCSALLFVLALGLAPCHAVTVDSKALESSLVSSWSKTLDGLPGANSNSPIQRVVKLLLEMKAQLEKEAENDEEIYDKMVCWCETNEKEKRKAIADADQKITDLIAAIEEGAARTAELETQIEHLKKEIGEETQAALDAEALREKEAGEFRDNE